MKHCRVSLSENLDVGIRIEETFSKQDFIYADYMHIIGLIIASLLDYFFYNVRDCKGPTGAVS